MTELLYLQDFDVESCQATVVEITELDDGKRKEKPKPKEKDEEKEMVKCPHCRAMHMPRPTCPNCGHEYPRKKAIEHVPGSLK